MVKPEGYAVGLFPGSDMATEELQLRKGDRLFLYSDGLVDCTNPAAIGSAPGVSWTWSRRAGDCRSPSWCRPLRREIVQWRGSESFADDVSLLALERE